MFLTPPPRTCSAAGEDLDEAVEVVDLLEDVAGEYLRRRSCCARAMVAVSDNFSPSADMDRERDEEEDEGDGEEPAKSKL
mmetsp:Transcript_34097/g.38360  ORF Transcript_34097/g.38360 Transcript_34097/m.38360 type:complete len:80 (+) Transcript_34097:725-964(+)